MKNLITALAALCAVGAAYAYGPSGGSMCTGACMVHRAGETTFEDRWPQQPKILYAENTVAQVTTTTPAPATVTVHGGDLAASFLEWLQAVFGAIFAGIGTLILVKIRQYFGLKTSEAQKAALQEIVTNGVNAAAAKAEAALKNNPTLDVNVKNVVAQDAVAYAQSHGAELIKALGLDPNSGDAVDALKARVATAMNDKRTPTIDGNKITPPAC